MSSKIMINCVSEIMSPARSICTATQLVHGIWGDHGTFRIVSKITHFIYRFIQCSQNTVVSLMGGIQHCIFLKNWQDFLYTCERLTISDGIICAQRNGRNIHEYLTKIKKSEENLQCFSKHNMIESSMDNNYNDFNDAKKRKRQLYVEKQTINTFGITTMLFHSCRQIFSN